jgi:hypothetical protein
LRSAAHERTRAHLVDRFCKADELADDLCARDLIPDARELALCLLLALLTGDKAAGDDVLAG